MNIKNLNRLIAVFEYQKGLKRGVGFNMTRFIAGKLIGEESYDDMDKFTRHHPCKTVACIAGHAAILAQPKTSIREMGSIGGMEKIATDWLGLDPHQAHTLFFGSGAYVGLNQITAADALKVLKHFRETGEVDWEICDPQ